jgi:hypothetical protein
MGMVMVARRLTSAELAGLRDEPGTAHELLADESGEAMDAGRLVDVDKAWHGIHFLLTGTAWEIGTPAANAVLGGRPIGEEVAYGPARLLEPDEVRDVAGALVDDATLRGRFDAARLQELEIYPNIWDEEDVLQEYVLPHYTALVEFYRKAAGDGSAVLLAIT